MRISLEYVCVCVCVYTYIFFFLEKNRIFYYKQEKLHFEGT
jgi:hypothetical protein